MPDWFIAKDLRIRAGSRRDCMKDRIYIPISIVTLSVQFISNAFIEAWNVSPTSQPGGQSRYLGLQFRESNHRRGAGLPIRDVFGVRVLRSPFHVNWKEVDYSLRASRLFQWCLWNTPTSLLPETRLTRS